MAHADNVRRYFPATRHVAFLNTGTFGAMPEVAVDAMQASLHKELHEGRGVDYYGHQARMKHKIREQLSHLLGAEPSSFALTDSTTAGMNLVVHGLRLNSGDEVIINDAEYPGALISLFNLAKQRGITLRVLNGFSSSDEFLTRLESALTPRTKLVVCSHVSYQTGWRMPIEQICDVAHRHHAYVLVDGAQGAGADAVNLTESSVDFYALPGQKWLCGPDGTGALYIRPDLLSVLDASFLSYASLVNSDAYNWTGSYLNWPDARRFEHTTVSLNKWVGFLESLQFMRVNIGWDFVYSRIQGMSGYLMDKLLDFDGLRILTPRDQRAGLVAFQLQRGSPESFVKEASVREIAIRSIAERQAVRVSTACYTNEDDLGRLVQLLEDYRRQT